MANPGEQRFKQAVQKLSYGLSYGGMFVLLPLMFLTSAEVVSRFVTGRLIPGTFEMSGFMLAIFVLCGLAYTHQMRGHVKVTMLLDRLPRRAALFFEVLTTFISLLVMLLVAWQGWVVALEQETVSDMLRIPQLPFRLLVTAAGITFSLELILELIDNLQKLGGR